jgi:hypothetical protein
MRQAFYLTLFQYLRANQPQARRVTERMAHKLAFPKLAQQFPIA